MISFLVIWSDLYGRLRFKSYVYRRCAEKFASLLILDHRALSDDVRFIMFDGRRVVKLSISKVSKCSTWNILKGVF